VARLPSAVCQINKTSHLVQAKKYVGEIDPSLSVEKKYNK